MTTWKRGLHTIYKAGGWLEWEEGWEWGRRTSRWKERRRLLFTSQIETCPAPTTAAPLLSYNQLQTDRCVCACAKWHNSSVYETTTQEGGVEWKGGSALLFLSLSAPPTHRMRRDARCLVVTVYSKSSQLQQCKMYCFSFFIPPSPLFHTWPWMCANSTPILLSFINRLECFVVYLSIHKDQITHSEGNLDFACPPELLLGNRFAFPDDPPDNENKLTTIFLCIHIPCSEACLEAISLLSSFSLSLFCV